MTGRRRFLKRALLVTASLAVGLLIAEVALWLSGTPRIYKPRVTPQHQFLMIQGLLDEGVGYVNAPSTVLRFRYDGNPRGYFGDLNEVDHRTNSAGFRGPPLDLERDGGGRLIIKKPPGTRRLAFLGDSFTFGEGVWFKDTYAEQTATLLRTHLSVSDPATLHAINLGVGGYNSEQERQLLVKVGLPSQPDIVVWGFVLNDAEPPLIQSDPATGSPRRAFRAIEEFGKRRPPKNWFYRLRTARLAWQIDNARKVSAETIDFYRSLYADTNPGWQKTQSALAAAADACGAAKVPFIVVIFPVLVQLDDRYPFTGVHEKVARIVAEHGGIVIDLLPKLKGRKAAALWVHPTDQHPNEIVHRIAAEAIRDEIVSGSLLSRK